MKTRVLTWIIAADILLVAVVGVVAVREAKNTVWSWDDGTPEPIAELDDVAAIAAGHSNLALREDGTVWSWAQRSGVVQVPGLQAATAVAAGGAFSLALDGDGRVHMWGPDNDLKTIDGLPRIRKIAAGGTSAFAIDAERGLWAWTGVTAPRRIATGVAGIAAGHTHALVVMADGTVCTCDRLRRLVAVDGLTDVVAAAAGASHSVALTRAGEVWTWYKAARPVRVPLEKAKQVAALDAASIAVLDNGTVWRWDGAAPDPRRVRGLAHVKALAADGSHCLALRE